MYQRRLAVVTEEARERDEARAMRRSVNAIGLSAGLATASAA